MANSEQRPRWVAIATGAVSILIGVLYLALITVLDARGPMRPPPPEALAVAAVHQLAVASAPQLDAWLWLESAAAMHRVG